MKESSEMTREELEKAYSDLLAEKTLLLGDNVILKKKYDEKPTYLLEYHESLEKLFDLRFAIRILCALTAPLLLEYSTVSLSNLPSNPIDFLTSVGIWVVVGAFVCFFARCFSELSFTNLLGIDIVKSKWITPLFIVLSAVLLSLAKF